MRVRGLAVVVLAVAVSAGLLAQSKTVFHSESNYVEVDAIVTDSNGDTVRGLTPADFVLKEDHKAQTIDTYEFVDLATASATGTAPRYRPELPADLRVANGRVYLIYIDSAATSELARLRQQASEFVQQFVLPNDIVGVWSADSAAQDLVFTNDKAALVNTIYASMGEVPAGAAPQALARAQQQRLIDAVSWLSSIQGRRKSLIYFTASLALSHPRTVLQLVNYPVDSATGVRSANAPLSFQNPVQSSLFPNWLAYPIAAAVASDIHVYGVDTSGLVAMGAPPSRQGAEFSTGGSGTPIEAQLLTQSLDAISRQDDGIISLSNGTGGLALTNRNTYLKDFAKIVQDNSQYYVLGYDLSNARPDGRFHEINVSVLRKGLTVRARKGYVGQ